MKISFIGLGTMGAPMAKRLVEAGYDVTVHNRTREREEPVADAGAKRTNNPKEAAENADLIITMVSDTPERGSCYFRRRGRDSRRQVGQHRRGHEHDQPECYQGDC